MFKVIIIIIIRIRTGLKLALLPLGIFSRRQVRSFLIMYKMGELTHMMTYNAIDHLGFFSRQIVLDNGYKAPNSAALAVAKIYPEEERPKKVTLDIGAGTGLLAEEVRDPPHPLV